MDGEAAGLLVVEGAFAYPVGTSAAQFHTEAFYHLLQVGFLLYVLYLV
jgi:hypothetical protein